MTCFVLRILKTQQNKYSQKKKLASNISRQFTKDEIRMVIIYECNFLMTWGNYGR